MSPWISEKRVPRPHREELIKHLLSLCRIFSPSGYELGVIEYCVPVLESRGFLVLVSPEGNIYATRGMPDSGKYVLLNAHTDTVQTKTDAAIMDSPDLVQYDKFWNVVYGRGYMVGGDDKAGVAAILTLATQTDLPMKILLTVREETHAIGGEMVPPAFYDDVSFALTLDRRHCCDVVDYYCGYYTAPEDISDLIIQIGKESNMAMKRADGSYADTAVITKYVPAVNLSIGYYNAHSPDDFIRVNETYDTMMLVAKCISRRQEFEDIITKYKTRQLQVPAPPQEVTEQTTFSRWSYQYGMKVPEKRKEEELVAKRYEKCPIDKDCVEKKKTHYQSGDLIWAEGYNPVWASIVEPGRVVPPPPPPPRAKVAARASFMPAMPLSREEEKVFAQILSLLINKLPVIVVKTSKVEEVTIEIKAPSEREVKYHTWGWLIFSAPNKTTTYIPLFSDRGSVLEINRVYVESAAAKEAIGSDMFSLITGIDDRENAETPLAIQKYIPEVVEEFHAALNVIDNEHYLFKPDMESMDLFSGQITRHKKGGKARGSPLATLEIFREAPSQAPYKFRSTFVEETGIYSDYESMQIVYGIFFRRDRFREKIEPVMAKAREILSRPLTKPKALPAAPKVKADQILDDPEAIKQFAMKYGDWSLSESERLDIMYCITQIAGALGKKQKTIKMLKKGPSMFQYEGSLVHPTINSVLGLYYHITYVKPLKVPTVCYREYMKRIIMRVEKLAELPDLRETPETTPTSEEPEDITDIYNEVHDAVSDFIYEYEGTLGRDIESFEVTLNEAEKAISARIRISAGASGPSMDPPFEIGIKVNLNLWIGRDNYCEITMTDHTGEAYDMGEVGLMGLRDALWDVFGLPALEDQIERLAEEGFSANIDKDDSFGEETL